MDREGRARGWTERMGREEWLPKPDRAGKEYGYELDIAH